MMLITPKVPSTVYALTIAVGLALAVACNSASGQVVDVPSTPLPDSPAAVNQETGPELTDPTPRQPQQVIPRPSPEPPGVADQTPGPENQVPGAGNNIQPVPPLNVDPNATIDQLNPPQAPTPPAAPQIPADGFGGSDLAGFGLTAVSYSSAPNIMGDFFGGGLATITGTQTIFFQDHAPGIILSPTGPGAANAILGFEFGNDVVPNDVFTTGVGQDTVGFPDGADTFSLAEPLPPNDALTSPGPGFVFDGGTAVYTDSPALTTAQAGTYQNGELWFIQYSFSRTLGINPQTGRGGRPIPSPGVATRRVKIAENFSPEVRDRAFFNYSFFNDAFGGLGDVSRYILGLEKILVGGLVSIEARLPMAGTYASRQNLDVNSARDFELGNTTLIMKTVLLRTDRLILSGGTGVALPTADDTIVTSGGQNIIRVRNESVHLLPFVGMLWRQRPNTFLQSYMQLDVAANGDPLFGNLLGGPLPQLGTFTDSTLLHLDFALSHSFYRNPERCVQEIIGNAELHYTGTLQSSDFITAGGLTYTNLKRNFNIVNATFGLHLILSDNLVVTPGMSIPLQDGLNRQFDYEAMAQVNYIH